MLKRKVRLRVLNNFTLELTELRPRTVTVAFTGTFLRKLGVTSVSEVKIEPVLKKLIIGSDGVSLAAVSRWARRYDNAITFTNSHVTDLTKDTILDVERIGALRWKITFADMQSGEFYATEEQISMVKGYAGFDLTAPEKHYSTMIVPFQVGRRTPERTTLDQWYEVLYQAFETGDFNLKLY